MGGKKNGRAVLPPAPDLQGNGIRYMRNNWGRNVSCIKRGSRKSGDGIAQMLPVLYLRECISAWEWEKKCERMNKSATPSVMFVVSQTPDSKGGGSQRQRWSSRCAVALGSPLCSWASARCPVWSATARGRGREKLQAGNAMSTKSTRKSTFPESRGP